MFKFFAKIFGYLLNFLYNLIGNYGVAIILFSIIVKILLLPLTIKQQKSLEKANEMQDEMKKIQEKYGNDKEKLNQEVMELYKKSGTNPFSGCFISIIQFILIISVFIMVRSPLTYMKKVDNSVLEKYTLELKEKNEHNTSSRYTEIDIIRLFGKDNEKVNINMNFVGIDLSTVPTEDKYNIKGWIIPVLYVVTSIISIRLTSNMNSKNKKNTDENKTEQMQEMEQMNKTMNFMMPIMSVSIAIIAPLGLSLYWFMSNILSIIERLFINKIQTNKEEAEA